MLLIYGKGKTGKSLKDLSDFVNIQAKIVDDSDFSKISNLNNFNKIVVSPGIPFFHQIFKKAKKEKIEIEGEIEFAHKFFNGKTISIIGTDGKSTTTKMSYEILKSFYEDIFIGGNYGIPFSEIVVDVLKKKTKNPIVVLELSSFQIYSTKNFKPDIVAFLNFSTDHLDWHKTEKHYLYSKLKIFKNLTEKETAILNFDDETTKSVETKAKKYFFSLKELPDGFEGIFLKENKFYIKLNSIEKPLFQRNIIKLKGNHNLQNAMVATLIGYLNNVPLKNIENTLKKFQPLPHRLEFVKSINGIDFYNDSKATTVQAVKKSIDSFEKNVILIAGGINKGGDFSKLNPVLKKKVKKVFLFGHSKNEIKEMIKSSTQVEIVNNLEEAVLKSFKEAEKGDTILLSPGCSSFDMFKSYADRGNRFKSLINSIK